MKWIRLWAAGILCWATAPAQAQEQPGAVIRTETRLVLVDSVVTDKKGEYVHDLSMKDFKVWEDNKEQMIKTFSFEADPASPANNRTHYLVLFFDNSTIPFGDQVLARQAAAKFIDSNAGPNRMIGIVNFTGALQIAQNFTDNVEQLKQVVSGTRTSAVAPNQTPSAGMAGQLSRAAGAFGARDMVLALRELAKNLGTIPGRKTLILLTEGMPLTDELRSEVTATLDVCNRSNVAIYPIDVRGLVSGIPRAGVTAPAPFGLLRALAGSVATLSAPAVFGFQQTGGGAGGGRSGSSGTSAPSAPAGPSRGAPGNSGNSGSGGRGSTGLSGTGTAGRGNTGGGSPAASLPPQMNPYNRSRDLLPKFPESTTTNQQIMFMLADGTGGFVIHDTNDLLGGLDKIGKEQQEYYILGYTPEDSVEGSCHVLRVKVDRSGLTVRSRTGYCNAKSRDLLSGNPVETDLESRIAATQAGTIPASMQVPYFYTAPGIARVNVTLEIAADGIKFEKVKGKFHADVHVLGIAYTASGSVGARFSDTLNLELPDKKQVDEFKEQPLHYENQFDVAAGQYSLKVVFSSGGASFGKVEMPLAVDPYQSSDFALSGLALSKQFVRVSDVGAGLDAALIEDKTPLITGNLEVIPSGSSQFHKGQPALFYCELYEPLLANPDPEHPAAVAIRIRVLDRQSGEVKEDTGAMRLEVPKETGNPVIRMAERVPVERLPAGAYTLEFVAQDSASQFARRTADFELQ
jgi:VWFA-related protein